MLELFHRLASGETPQGICVDTEHVPAFHVPCAEPLVEGDRALVPIENPPLETTAISLHRDPSQAYKEVTPDSGTSRIGSHEEIFQIDARASEKRGVVMEEERESDGSILEFCDQDLGIGVWAE